RGELLRGCYRAGHRGSDEQDLGLSEEEGQTVRPDAVRATRAASVRRLRATRRVSTIPPAMANAALLIPWAVAIRSSSSTSPSLPEFATTTKTARPTTAPIPELVETMPEATPCSRSVTPVDAAMNIVVNTIPSPMLRVMKPGISMVKDPSGDPGDPPAPR